MLSSQHLATRNCSESAWRTADTGPDVWDDLEGRNTPPPSVVYTLNPRGVVPRLF